MSLLSELKVIIEDCGIDLETGVFSDTPPETYAVITPLSDTFDLHADNLPEFDIQEARISLFSKGNYTEIKDALTSALLWADVVITDRRYISHEDDTGYHHTAIDVAKAYEMEE